MEWSNTTLPPEITIIMTYSLIKEKLSRFLFLVPSLHMKDKEGDVQRFANNPQWSIIKTRTFTLQGTQASNHLRWIQKRRMVYQPKLKEDLNDPEDLIFQDTLSRQFKGCNGTGREKAQLFAYHWYLYGKWNSSPLEKGENFQTSNETLWV